MSSILDAALLTAVDADTDPERACCCYAQAVIERAYGLPPATGDLLAKWRIFQGQDAWSPVEAAHRVGVVDAIYGHLSGPMVPDRGRWHLVQGWRGVPFAPGVSGHTFLWRAASAEVGLQVESAIPAGPGERRRRWADVVAEFKGGLAVAVLRRV